MTDLTDSRILWLKAGLFVLCGVLAVVGLLLEHASLTTALLLGVTIWSFCRAYYFVFHVIEHYTDSSFRYAGLFAALRHLIRHRL